MKFRFQFLTILICACLFGVLYSDIASGQQQNSWTDNFKRNTEKRFSNGVIGQPRTQPSVKRDWPKLFRSKNTQRESRPVGWGNMDWLKPKNQEKGKLFDYSTNNSRPKMFDNMKKMFPPRDPDRPNLFAEMNDKTKAFFERRSQGFSNWANRNSEKAKSRTFESWDAITKGFREPQPEGAPQLITRPEMRSARQIDNQPRVKF